jgi:hypothetical protein
MNEPEKKSRMDRLFDRIESHGFESLEAVSTTTVAPLRIGEMLPADLADHAD